MNILQTTDLKKYYGKEPNITKALDALGVQAQIGETVSLTYEVKGKSYTTDFTLCGFWETDSLSNIGRLINRQALRLSLIGIPIGLLLGFFIGRALVPFLMNGTSYTADAGIKVTVNPLTFIGSAAFALFTVFVSVHRPAKIAGMVSAIEAIRYTENDTAAFGKHRAKDKKSTRGGKLHFMALANLSRSRKRTILVIVSMTLSLVLFNTVFTLSSGFDIDKYIAKFMDTDFVLSTADYFQFQFEKSASDLSENFIEAVKQNEGFEDGGRLYTSRMLEEPFSTEHNAFFSYNKDQNGNPFVSLYGAD